MKKLFGGNIKWGYVAHRETDGRVVIDNGYAQAAPDSLRWFGGMHDMDATFVCRAL